MSERRLSTDVWAFLRAFGGRWFILMSGPPTVPLAGLALFVGNTALRVLFVVLAVACGVFSAYWVWRQERIARNEAEARIQPRLEFVVEDCCRRQSSLGCIGVANPSAVSVTAVRGFPGRQSRCRTSAGPSFCSKNGYEARWRARRDMPGSM